jgi:2-polyprenyl-3-methyl-5-hydroxy-6-metoxy-1,4-benzoquinol methylase
MIVQEETTMSTTATAPTADEFAERLFQSSLGFVEVLSTYLGDRLGWYRDLAAGGPATPDELVGRAGGSPRYAREWLEQQAVFNVLTVDPDGRFRLPEGAAEVLTNEDSLSYLAPLARMFAAAGAQLPALLDAYRSDGGVSWSAYGIDMRESQADMNRPWFEHKLPDVLRSLPEVDAALRHPDALIADVGCGAGWSTLAIGRTYPQARVEGWDVDRPSIDLARANALTAGLEERVSFSATDASQLADGAYDAIFAFECIHDMSQPVATLMELRRAVKLEGAVIVMDEAVADEFAPGGDDLERLMYGFSLLVCLPDGMSARPTAATGTVMRHSTLLRYAREAGFSDVEVLPTGEFGFWRFYRLVP